MAYTRGPYAARSSLPVPDRPTLYSSRKIVAPTQRYELDATTYGNAQMDSVAQRVLIAVSLADIPSKFVTEQEANETRGRIIAALAPLTDGPAPTIELLSVTVGSEETGSTYRRIQYRNLTTGLNESVEP
jgi:hypothetical protein